MLWSSKVMPLSQVNYLGAKSATLGPLYLGKTSTGSNAFLFLLSTLSRALLTWENQ
jgi:hypothetical protein